MIISYKQIARLFPELELKLKESGMNKTPEQFIKQTAYTAFFMTTGGFSIFFVLLKKLELLSFFSLLLIPLLFGMLFLYFMRLPHIKSLHAKRKIDMEILDATRYLIIELESGIPLYESIDGVRKNFEVIGKFFKSILTKINTGMEMEVALTKAAESTSSEQMRRVLWQILNSLQTGASISTALKEINSQIGKEQLILIRGYGKKLNPLAMFYMMMAVVIPSLGITMVTVMSSFLGLQIDLIFLILVAMFLSFIQFIFLGVVKSSRPAVNM